MGSRRLTEEEISILSKKLKTAKDHQLILNRCITDTEQELSKGTVWEYEPEAFKQMCREVEEEAKKFAEFLAECERQRS